MVERRNSVKIKWITDSVPEVLVALVDVADVPLQVVPLGEHLQYNVFGVKDHKEVFWGVGGQKLMYWLHKLSYIDLFKNILTAINFLWSKISSSDFCVKA